MLNTFRLSFALKNTYRANAILHSLKQIPLLKQLLPDTLYQVRGLKIAANVLAVLWELITIFLYKYLYFFLMVCGLGMVRPDLSSKEVFLHTLLFLTLIGSYTNTGLFRPTRDAYYAIILLRMDARSYTLVHYGYAMLKILVGFLPCTILFGRSLEVPLWQCLLIPFSVAGVKLAVGACSLRSYEKTGCVPSENKLRKYSWLFSGILLALAYLLPAMGTVLSLKASAVLWAACIPAGLAGLRRVVTFRHYRAINQEILTQVVSQTEVWKKAAKTATQKAISADPLITSRKQGFEYLNELFIRRHRKILWRSALRIAAVCATLCCCVLLFLQANPDLKPEINEIVMTWFPYWVFILYLINRGTGFTSALFMNCDHSLLTYSFYKRPGFILHLFQIRLREIIKINAVPALVLGISLCLILYASGGTDAPLNYIILIVSILAMSIFFSIHYLTAYYLLQPYTAGTEIKSGTYRIVMTLTYGLCCVIANLRLPILLFGLSCIVFCILYSLAASLLVYRLAPQTFRLRT